MWLTLCHPSPTTAPPTALFEVRSAAPKLLSASHDCLSALSRSSFRFVGRGVRRHCQHGAPRTRWRRTRRGHLLAHRCGSERRRGLGREGLPVFAVHQRRRFLRARRCLLQALPMHGRMPVLQFPSLLRREVGNDGSVSDAPSVLRGDPMWHARLRQR